MSMKKKETFDQYSMLDVCLGVNEFFLQRTLACERFFEIGCMM